jgi:hypothetical protein
MIMRLGVLIVAVAGVTVLGCKERVRRQAAEAHLPMHRFRGAKALSLSGRAQWSGDTALIVIVELHNEGTVPEKVETGVCHAQVRAFHSPELQEPAFWDSHPDFKECPDVGLEYTIMPGARDTIFEILRVSEFAMGLPKEGGYFGIVLDEEDRRRLLDAGFVAPP